MPFDQIIPQVVAGNYEAGLIIHEGQLTYAKAGLQRIVDLGKWWLKVTGLPLPLGGNAIRRSLGPELTAKVSGALRDSIQYALDHRDEALAYAMQFARDVDPQLADKFVGMYVNERTLDYGPDGREAVRRLLDMGHKAGIIPREARVEFVVEVGSFWLLAPGFWLKLQNVRDFARSQQPETSSALCTALYLIFSGNENTGSTSTGTFDAAFKDTCNSAGMTSYFLNQLSARSRSPVASISRSSFARSASAPGIAA